MNFRYDPVEEKLVVTQATRIEYHQSKLWLTRKVKNWKFLPAVKMGVWDGNQSYFDNGKVNLGLWKECYNGCKEIGVTFNIENRDEFPLNREVTLDKVKDFCKEFFKNHQVRDKEGNWHPFTPYDYQIETAYKILRNRYCLASVATSGGKSFIISIVYFYTLKHINPDAKLLIIVPSISLVSQFYDNILEYNYGFNNLTKYGDKVDFRNHMIDTILNDDPTYNPCAIRMEEVMSERPRKFVGPQQPNVYIGTYQSLDKWPKEFFHQFHSVVVDECLHPDTKILMSDGSYRKISEIKIGESVKTINEHSKQIEDKRVEYVYENLSKNEDMYEIELENGNLIKITGNHKVYCSDFKWKMVKDLTVDDEIIDINFNI
jgi:hypothetical protein